MQYGICPLSIVPLRAEPKNASEQTSQLLYGEFFTIIDPQKSWSKIQGGTQWSAKTFVIANHDEPLVKVSFQAEMIYSTDKA